MKTIIMILIAFYTCTGFSQTYNTGWDFQIPYPHGNIVFHMVSNGTDVIQVGEKGVISISTNNGSTFQLKPVQTENDLHEIAVISSTEYFAVGKDGGFSSTNRGETWTKNHFRNNLYSTVFINNTLFIGGDSGYVAKSTNNGISFTVIHNNPVTDIRSIAAISSSNIFAGGTFGKILRTTNGGSNWDVFNPVSPVSAVTSIDFFNSLRGAASFQGGVLTTTNGGQNWNILTPPGSNLNYNVIKFFSIDEFIAAGNAGTVAKTTNFGLNFIVTNLAPGTRLEALRSDGFDNAYVIGEWNFGFKSTDRGNTWEHGDLSFFKNFRNWARYTGETNRSQQYDTMYALGDSGTVVKTTNGGESFQLMNTGTTLDIYAGTFFDGSTGFVVGGRSTTGIVLKTTNGGANWTQSNPLGDLTRNIYFINAQTGLICGSGGKVRRTTNGGANWTVCSIPSSSAMHSIDFVDANTGVICAANGNMVRTQDAGETWFELSGLSGTQLSVSFADMNTGVAVGLLGVMYRTTNAGLNWTLLPPITQNTLYSVQLIGDLGFACGTNFGNDAGIVKTTDHGQTWFKTNSGTNNQLNGILFINSTTGFALGAGGTILKTTNGGTPIGITQISAEVPKNYLLGQNYPNPFNPVTKIRFQLPQSAQIKLEIYDLLGRLIEVVADGSYKAGTYEADWNAANYASGVYFYKLVTEKFIETKKMVLVK